MHATATTRLPDRRAFVFSPRGSPALELGAAQFSEPSFRQVLDACDAVIQAESGWSLTASLERHGTTLRFEAPEACLEPAITAMQIASAAAWRARGVEPAAVAGMSGGEFAAAQVAGALKLEDAMRVACCVGDIFRSELGRGRTIFVPVTRRDADALLKASPHALHVAAHYSPGSVAIAGQRAAVDQLVPVLEARGVRWRDVHTGYALHSPLMDGHRAAFVSRLSGLQPRAASLPVYSAAAGGLLQGAAFDAEHWWTVFRETARFASAVCRLLQDGFGAFVDFGIQAISARAVTDTARLMQREVYVVSASATDTGIGTAADGIAAAVGTPPPATVRCASTAPFGVDGSAAPVEDGCDPFDPDARLDPYPLYGVLRERGPVHYHQRRRSWLILGYDEAKSVLKDTATYSSSILARIDRVLLGADPPDHTRVRRVMADALTPRKMTALEEQVRQVTHRRIDRLGGRDSFDLIGELAIPVPLALTCTLIGFDESEGPRLHEWANAVVEGGSGTASVEQRARIRSMLAEFEPYFMEHVQRCKQEPGRGIFSGLLGGNGGTPMLTDEEALSLARLLSIAANETTTNLIGNAVLALLRHPDQEAFVRADRSRIPRLLEEVLRYDPPVPFVHRLATRSVELGGHTIPAGSLVTVVIGSAHRDPREFADPERFDVARKAGTHLGFGMGPHFCLGAYFGRLSARIVLDALFDLVPHLEATEPLDRIEMVNSDQVRGLRHLHLSLQPTLAVATSASPGG